MYSGGGGFKMDSSAADEAVQGSSFQLARHLLRRNEAIRSQQLRKTAWAPPSLLSPAVEVDLAMAEATTVVVSAGSHGKDRKDVVAIDKLAGQGEEPIGPRPTLASGYRYSKRDVDHDGGGTEPPTYKRVVDKSLVGVPVFPPRRTWRSPPPSVLAEPHADYFQLKSGSIDRDVFAREYDTELHPHVIRAGVELTLIKSLDLSGAPIGMWYLVLSVCSIYAFCVSHNYLVFVLLSQDRVSPITTVTRCCLPSLLPSALSAPRSPLCS